MVLLCHGFVRRNLFCSQKRCRTPRGKPAPGPGDSQVPAEGCRVQDTRRKGAGRRLRGRAPREHPVMCRPLAGPWDFPEQREPQVCAPHCLSINLPTTCLRGSPAWLSGGLAGLLRGFRKDCGVQGVGIGAGHPLPTLGRGSPQQQQRRQALGRKGAPQGRHQHPRRRAGWRGRPQEVPLASAQPLPGQRPLLLRQQVRTREADVWTRQQPPAGRERRSGRSASLF